MTDPRPVRAAPRLVEFLATAHIDEAVSVLRPDYRALLVAVEGLIPVAAAPAAGTDAEELLARAEASAADLLASTPVEAVPHVAAWRDAYRAFGAKPQRTRNSLEALLRRAGDGLPRVNPLTDAYNSISVLHQVPLGGENLDAYVGAPRLIRANGREVFDTVVEGEQVLEHPEAGEVVWCDDAGVTCRRWNWRQGRRTQLTQETTAALFILDALAPMADDALTAAGQDLTDHLRRLSPDIRMVTRLLAASTTRQEHA
jgi:DNA/RNA-binding domain of Phe-tRNA-synthetase-like protein